MYYVLHNMYWHKKVIEMLIGMTTLSVPKETGDNGLIHNVLKNYQSLILNTIKKTPAE